MDWTAKRVGALIAFWNQGLSASEIGRRLDVTKNAVVGKVHRIGLQKRTSPIARKDRQADVIKLENLKSGMCSWPEGDPGTDAFQFCGKPVAPDKPYCPEHCDKAYVTIVKDRKRAAA